jgi:hydrogenase maturation protease
MYLLRNTLSRPARRAFVSPPVTVIGIGNPYRRDDGAAACVLARLAPLIDPAQVRLVELDGEPVRLVQSWEGSHLVWLVDAVRSGRPVGSFHEFAADGLAGRDDRGMGFRGGHLMGLADAVDLARVLDLLPASLRVLGIEGVDFTEGVGLSPAVDAGCTAVAAHLAAEIQRALEALHDQPYRHHHLLDGERS